MLSENPCAIAGDSPIRPIAGHNTWPVLTKQLVQALTGCVTAVREPADAGTYEAQRQRALDTAQAGAAMASVLVQELPDELGSPDSLNDYPLMRLASAYTAAFQAVVQVSQLMDQGALLRADTLTQRLVELALDAAATVVPAIDLLIGQRRLGNIVQMCEHVGVLEDRADAHFREAVAARLQQDGRLGHATHLTTERTRELRMLSALEALTDRCEDIADMLLVVALLV